MLMVTTFLPIISYNLPPIIGSYHLFAIIWLLLLFLFKNNLLLKNILLYLIVYTLVFIILFPNTLQQYMDEWNRNFIATEMYNFIIAISVLFYFIYEKDYKGLNNIVNWTLVFIVITSIMTIISANQDPLYARYIISGNWYTPHETNYFNKLGGGNYGFASAIVILIPTLIFLLRHNTNSGIDKLKYLLIILISYYALLRIQLFANILIATIIFPISLYVQRKSYKSIFVLLILMITVFSVPITVYADFLYYISNLFHSTSLINDRLTDMANYLSYGEEIGNQTGSRIYRYPMLVHVFMDNPLFGCFYNRFNQYHQEGIHLYWMNKLTTLGILGFVPFIIFHLKFIRIVNKLGNYQFSIYFIINIISITGLGVIKQLTGRELWFTYFFLIPGIYLINYNKEQNTNFND